MNNKILWNGRLSPSNLKLLSSLDDIFFGTGNVPEDAVCPVCRNLRKQNFYFIGDLTGEVKTIYVDDCQSCQGTGLAAIPSIDLK